MAPIKFEEHIKEKLDQREIKPTNLAWDKISLQLKNKPAKKKHGFIWYAVAASIIGLLIASFFLFTNRNDAVINQNNVVVKDKIEKANEVQNKQETVEKELVIEPENRVEVAENNKALEVKQTTSPKPVAKENVASHRVVNSNVTVVDTKQVLAENKPVKKDKTKEELFADKIQELIAQVDSLELNGKTPVSDAEIEKLLRKAQNELAEQKIFRDNNTVDAMALLAEAEDELNVSFRDQIFETLKNGYLKVRTAVADRSN